MKFEKMDQKRLKLNPMTTFLENWPLLTAGNETIGYNTMTISWGHLGGIWNKPTMIVYVRPQRHTKEFMDQMDEFTVSVLPKEYKKALHYLGTASGRDEDKIKKAGLTPITDGNGVYFEEASMVFVCRKLYDSPICEQGFIDQKLMADIYPEADFHTMYVGEIMDILSPHESR